MQVVTAMREWGDRWAAPGGPPVRMRHATCGQLVTVEPVCSHCGERLDVGALTVELGPGADKGDFARTRMEHLTR